MMDSDVPFDTSDPRVRDYLSLIRLQVLTPLSLLVNIATLMVCSTVIAPSLARVSELFPTSISPKPEMIAVYGIAIYIGQIGYCLMLVLARKPETKRTLIKGSGQSLVWANWVVAGWAVAFVMQQFLIATVLLGIALILLLFANIRLFTFHRPTSARPLDTLLIHAPVRLYFILPFSVLFAQTLFIALGHSWSPGEPQHYARHQWEGFGVVLVTNVLGLLIVIFRRDVVWCVGAAWLAASVWSERPKPFPIYITAVIFTAAHPLALVASALFVRLRHPGGAARSPKPARGHGPIALPADDAAAYADDLEGGPATRGGGGGGGGAEVQGAREVDAEAIWG